MRNLYRNGIVLALAVCFAAFGFVGEAIDAQTKNSKKATPTPAKKSTPKDAKAKAKSTPKPTPKSKTAATASKTNAKTKPTPKPSKTPVKSKSNTTARKEKTDSKSKAENNQKPKTNVSQKSKKDNASSSKKDSRSPSKSSDNTKTPPKSNSSEQIIVVTTDSRIREQPKTSATQIGSVKIGKLLPVLEKTGSWHRVQYEPEKSGWIQKTLTRNFDDDDRDEIYQDIANKYLKDKSLDFAEAAEVSDFLRTAQALAKKDQVKAELGLKRLQILAAAMRAVPFGKGDSFPYKTFLQSHDKEVVYSEPSAAWMVRSDLYWELHNKYMQSAIAEDIAWAAARNAIPGECEGYINCQLYALRVMEGEYLNFYPNGKYSRQALELATASLGVMVAQMNNKETFTPLADISDRAEFNRFLTELRMIISKVSDTDKAKPLQQINQLGEGYK